MIFHLIENLDHNICPPDPRKELALSPTLVFTYSLSRSISVWWEMWLIKLYYKLCGPSLFSLLKYSKIREFLLTRNFLPSKWLTCV